MAQDTSSLPISSVPPAVGGPTDSPQVVPPVLAPILVDPANVVHAHEVQVDGDVLAVPQETVGLGDLSASVAVNPPAVSEPVAMPSIEPVPVVEPIPPVSVAEPSLPVVDEDLSPDAKPADSVPADSVVTDTDASPSADTDTESAPDGEKSPLDILEEILAGAEAEKKQVDEEAQKKEQEELAFQAQMDAKTAEFKIEADERLKQSHIAVEQAKQQRTDIDQQLIDQGKLEPQVAIEKDEFSIRQLEHQKPE